MDSSQLDAAQRFAILAQLNPARDYLNRLVARMESQGFPADDPALLRAQEATAVLSGLIESLAAPPRD